VGPASPARRLSQGVGMLSEDRKEEGLAGNMSVADNMTLSRLDAVGPFGFIPPAKQESSARRWIERLGIRCRNTRQPVSDLSGGNQQKVVLARWLSVGVRVFIMDEPTRGIDVGSKSEIYQIMADLAEQGVEAAKINKVLEGRPHIVDAIKNGGVHLVFNTTEGATALADSRSLRHAALLHKVPYYTTLSGAVAAAQGIKAYLGGDLEVRALQSYYGGRT